MSCVIQMAGGVPCAVVRAGDAAIGCAQDALDLIMSVFSETGCTRIALAKEALPEAFFVLRTGLAGEILQKVVSYRMKLAVFGDFSRYESKPLRDFIRESNRGVSVFFVMTESEALEKLAAAP